MSASINNMFGGPVQKGQFAAQQKQVQQNNGGGILGNLLGGIGETLIKSAITSICPPAGMALSSVGGLLGGQISQEALLENIVKEGISTLC